MGITLLQAFLNKRLISEKWTKNATFHVKSTMLIAARISCGI